MISRNAQNRAEDSSSRQRARTLGIVATTASLGRSSRVWTACSPSSPSRVRANASAKPSALRPRVVWMLSGSGWGLGVSVAKA